MNFLRKGSWQPSSVYAPIVGAAFICALLLSYALLTERLPHSGGEVELLFPRTSESLRWYQFESKQFDNSYTDVIVLSLPQEAPRDEIDFLLEQLEEELLSKEEVSSLVFPRRTSQSDLFGLKSKDGQFLRIILRIRRNLSEEQRVKFNDSLTTLLKNYESLAPIRAGSFYTSREVAEAVSTETGRIIPWIIVGLVFLLVMLFKNLKVVLVILGSTGLAIGTTLLVYSIGGYTLGPVSQLAPPFLLAVGASFHLHFATRLLGSSREEFSHVERELRQGISLAAFTTAGSVLSLVFLDVEDVTRFALLASAGVALSAFYACTLQTRFLRQVSEVKVIVAAAPAWLFQLINRRVVLTALSLGVLLGIGVFRLQVHTDPLGFLPKKSEALGQIRRVNSMFLGNHYLTVNMVAQPSKPFPKDLSFLEPLAEKLQKGEGVTRVITPYHLDQERKSRASADFVSGFSMWDDPVGSDFLSEDRTRMRLLIETPSEGRDLLALRDALSRILQRAKSLSGLQIGFSSFELIMASQSERIIRGLLESLFATLLVVFLLLLVIFRKLQFAFIGLVPNLLPLLVVFGLLGFAVVDLDLGSCLVASSALGVAVDNTFHFLLCWKARYEVHHDRRRATFETVQRTYPPFSIATVVLVCSFLTMAIARSAPVARFGVLLAVTLLVGLFADLVLLPCFLGRARSNDSLVSVSPSRPV